MRGVIQELDAQDAILVADRQARREALKGPQVGDFVRLRDGSLRRFTHDWGDTIQTTCVGWCQGDQSFFLNWSGTGDFSGSLDSAICKTRFVLTTETMEGKFWIFHHDRVEAYNGISFLIPCRVYEEREPGCEHRNAYQINAQAGTYRCLDCGYQFVRP